MTGSFSLYSDQQMVAQVQFNPPDNPDKLIHYQADKAKNYNLKFYSDFYAQKDNPLKATREIQFFQLIKLLKTHIPNERTPHLLDIGCGQGDFVRFLENAKTLSIQAYGIEPSLSNESTNIKRRLLQEVASSHDMPQSYDIISLLDVFEHFPDTNEALTQIHSRLKPQGLLLLKVPNKGSLLYRIAKGLTSISPNLATKFFNRLYQVHYPPPHYYYFNAASLTNLISSHFEILKIQYLSECPIGGLRTRFWGIPFYLKPFAMVAGFTYRLFSLGSLNDSVVILARKKRP